MSAIAYRYAEGNLLEERNTYFYTPFQGKAFLAAWRNQREGVRSSLPPPEKPQTTVSGDDFIDGDRIDSKKLLIRLYAQFEKDDYSNRPEDYTLLNQLVQRFEVSKRIHEVYDTDLHAVDKDSYHNLELYLLFGEVMEAAYNKTNQISYLNALLKCVDILSAYFDKIDKNLRGRMAQLVVTEQNHITSLAQLRGVDI
jgi:methionyl-tRNA formyltransferase